MKLTKQRKFVISILEQSKTPLTAEEIFKMSDEINLSTIYRTLAALTEAGRTLKNVGQDGKAYFQLNTPRHGHHLICAVCKETILIDSCPISQIASDLEKKTGYRITGHNLEFSGICPHCIDQKERDLK